MEKLLYTVIKDRKQYNSYCDLLFKLACEDAASLSANKNREEAMLLLQVLVDDYDNKNSGTTPDLGPIELIKYLMKENKINSKILAEQLDISRGTLSNILHYRRALSKELIQKLAVYFKLNQESLNRPYEIPADEELKDQRMQFTYKSARPYESSSFHQGTQQLREPEAKYETKATKKPTKKS